MWLAILKILLSWVYTSFFDPTKMENVTARWILAFSEYFQESHTVYYLYLQNMSEERFFAMFTPYVVTAMILAVAVGFTERYPFLWNSFLVFYAYNATCLGIWAFEVFQAGVRSDHLFIWRSLLMLEAFIVWPVIAYYTGFLYVGTLGTFLLFYIIQNPCFSFCLVSCFALAVSMEEKNKKIEELQTMVEDTELRIKSVDCAMEYLQAHNRKLDGEASFLRYKVKEQQELLDFYTCFRRTDARYIRIKDDKIRIFMLPDADNDVSGMPDDGGFILMPSDKKRKTSHHVEISFAVAPVTFDPAQVDLGIGAAAPQ